MNQVVEKTKIQDDGLHYKSKAAGSPYSSGIGLTMSCVKCGKHVNRGLLTGIKIAGKHYQKCKNGCVA
jgi:hypothetical protein